MDRGAAESDNTVDRAAPLAAEIAPACAPDRPSLLGTAADGPAWIALVDKLLPPLVAWLLRRIAGGMLALLAASVLIFFGTQVLPGDPAAAILGRNATPAAIKVLDRKLDADRPALARYGSWLGGLVRGDLGQSSGAIASGYSDTSVWHAIHEHAQNTAILALITVVLLVPLSLLLGAYSALRAGGPVDAAVMMATVVFASMPEFVVGALLITMLFAEFHLLPSISLVAPGHNPVSTPDILVLPVLTLLLVSLGWTTRFVRSAVLEVLNSDYVQMARLNGYSEMTVLWRYALRNAVAPSIQIFAITIQWMFGGVIVVETVFAYRGLGTELVNAVSQHDVTMIDSIAMIFGAIYIGINILADLIVVLLVPKLRTRA